MHAVLGLSALVEILIPKIEKSITATVGKVAEPALDATGVGG